MIVTGSDIESRYIFVDDLKTWLAKGWHKCESPSGKLKVRWTSWGTVTRVWRRVAE